MTDKKNFTPEDIAKAKALYESGAAPVAALRDVFGLSDSAIRRRIQKWGWARPGRPTTKSKSVAKAKRPRTSDRRSPRATMPKPTGATAAPRSAIARAVEEKPPADTASLIAALRHALEAEIAAVRGRIDAGAATDANARALSSFARTLSVLRALETTKNDGAAHEADITLDLADLRRELARRIDLLRDERDAAETS